MKNKIIWISTLIIAIFISFQYWNALQVQTAFPSEQWSRSFPITTEQSNYSKLQSVAHEDGYTISLLDFKKLVVLSCDSNMICETNRIIDELSTSRNTWSDHENSFYIRDNQLIHSTSQTAEVVIAANVMNFTKTDNTLIYWTEDQQVIVLDQSFSKEQQRLQLAEPITFAKILNNEVFIVTENKKGQYFTVHHVSDQLSKLFTIPVNGPEVLSSMHILQLADGGYSFLLDTDILAGGKRTKTILAAPFDLSLNQSPTFSKLTFVDNEKQLKNIRFPQIYQSEQGPIITFSASLNDMDGNRVDKVFVSNSFGDVVDVSAVTKIDNRYERSMLINDQTVVYFKMTGPNRSLEYSSSNEQIKQASNGIMEGDYLAAAYAVIGDLFNGLLLILFSFIWITITLAITYGVSSILHRIKLASAYKVAYMIHLIVLFSTQFVFFHKFSLLENLIFRMPYVTESWQFTIVLVASIIISTLPFLIFKYKVSEDTFHSIILYTTFMNVTILFFAIGPYLF
ncbi:hypothetical protein [Psychrobacillus sp.]|uniref:hypothetical protein n=1 Tax=Psychrobacillus sp. TaxID=1871623 RepID=UPI0028BE6627|nr:hypothetical protein [Psychrobacillus sp.]